MNLHSLGFGLLALAACQATPADSPLPPSETFAEVTFEFDT